MKHFFAHFRGDLLGGITAGIVALPLALAFGASSGLGPSAGLYGAIFLSFFAALFGGTPTQISGPTAPMTAVSMVLIAELIALNNGVVSQALPGILMVFLLAGLMQVGLGFLKMGKYIRYIPYPVVSGFMTAIGLIIIITQLLPALGYYPEEDAEFVSRFRPYAQEVLLEKILTEETGDDLLRVDHLGETIRRAETITEEDIMKESKTVAGAAASGVIGAIRSLPRALSHIRWLEFLLCAITIAVIYGFKKITTTVPSTLVALILVSGVAYAAGLEYRPIASIPEGFPIPEFSMFTGFSASAVTPYLFTAFTLALLGAIDSLLTSVVADNMTRTTHNPNRELIGQGIGNSVAALFGGLPGAGATIRTVVNIKAGGVTRLSGMTAGVLLLLILLVLGPVASQIPAAVLAGILITVGISVMDYKGLKAIATLPRDIRLGPFKISSEVLIMIVVILLSTFWNLVYAVGVGLVIASLMFMKKIGDLTAIQSDVFPLKREHSWPDEKIFPSRLEEEVFIKHLKGPLFFGTTTEFQQLAKQIPKTATTVIIRLGRVPYMDQSGLYAMEEVLRDLESKKITVLLVNIMQQPRYMMERIDIIPDLVPETHIFRDFAQCVAWVQENVADVVP
ncbi:SulP family inorganic anion transporter [Robiginitalea marina]|uniref:SulP family inorganic anion transporter n=1 Tax=Robiginitalea marina TaxID=2954105 RepID=A0ABT1AYH0_9FLAO|nr:SulP family inorganic anion transporter [Robiginitalea marina]MCO5724418.1 SulP family inorganic anion transporter [Robiginitalea marina]